jgi:hypothetical protein
MCQQNLLVPFRVPCVFHIGRSPGGTIVKAFDNANGGIGDIYELIEIRRLVVLHDSYVMCVHGNSGCPGDFSNYNSEYFPSSVKVLLAYKNGGSRYPPSILRIHFKSVF